ncbi:MAG: PhnD/SsuA/transferrin family substrate-binding protein [Nitriliruptoraceae bacterium]|nr:PhnD/SsuA/transferrin family substrate-binding protein [Nitriliruptoraceae bacterium]
MKIRKWAAFLAASTLLLAACGTDDDADEPETDDTAEDTTDDDAADEPEDEGDDDGEAAGDVPEDWPDELVLTLQPAENPEALFDDADALAALLADRLGIAVSATVPDDYQAVIVALQSGAADIGGGFGPVNIARAMDQAGAEPILQSERFGEFLYVSQWFTNDPDTFCGDEPVEETYEDDGVEYTMLFCNGVNELETSEDGPIGLEFLENVGDVTISFVAEGSASGQVFPAFGLIQAGFDLDELDTIIAGGHVESVLAVANGDAVVGVSYNDAREDLVEERDTIGEEVVVFAWSDPIPNDGFVIRGDLPQSLKDAVTEALLDIANDEADGEILLDLYNIDGFRPADPADFENARQVDNELGELLG